ncbi:hypothetical protein GMOD_00001823 [Pyrenophora seminiperda CCB06]|uniref:Uncharacterized protein n=1 Tax=Pyrenophora seminiperda CCB06 TaxID=1302712 RepID=A0A3M7LW84_9PLEO|nr:hypothetical protein GMOD_00001823 [Pyrenophora seminiperda CCB06]
MASRANFWAAGNKSIKSASSPNPTIADALPKPKLDTMLQQKKGLVLKPMRNGSTNGDTNGSSTSSSTPTRKKTDWADEEEDTDFLTHFVKDPRIATLETTIVLKDERVKELEATVVTKTLRIAELEATVQDQDYRIGDLEADSKDKDARLGKLEEENREQFIQVQELLRDASNKDKCIAGLEYELRQKPVTMHDHELKSNSDTPTSTNDGDEVIALERTTTNTSTAAKIADAEPIEVQQMAEAEKAKSDTDMSDSFEMVEASKSEEPVKEFTETATKEKLPSTETTPDRSSEKPDLRDSHVTKVALKVVPPAPKPKTLTFPIDFSKYAKKPTALATKTEPKLPSPMSARNGHTTPWGRSAKQARVKTDAKPTFNPSADIRQMPLGERIKYANGPDVMVKLGEVTLMTIPKYILMQCSSKALQYFNANPDAISWDFAAGSMDADAAKTCLTWMDEMTFQGRVYSITLSAVPAHDKRNISVCHVARVMGLNNTYVGHFTKQLCDRIRKHEASYEFMDTVCELAYLENDPIFECLANNLVNQKKVGSVKDMAGVEKLVAKHKVLKTKMEEIEKKIAGHTNMRKTGNSPMGSQRGGSNERHGGVRGAGGNERHAGFRGAGGKKSGHGGGVAPGIKPAMPSNSEAPFSRTH